MMPVLTIFIFRKINGFSTQELSERKKRYMPFFLTIISYVFCLVMMNRLNIPWYMSGIILAALIMMVICLIVNLKWKLSEHMAGAGAVIGGLVAFSALFGYNHLRDCQPEVETERTHGRCRCCHRRPGGLQRAVRLQPGVVAMRIHHGGRRAGHSAHHPETPHAGPRWARCWEALPWDWSAP